MSQKSSTTTTSFIISSDESLNKPSLSSSQSIDSSCIMVSTTGSAQSSQYFMPLNRVDSEPDTMALNQSNQIQQQQNTTIHPNVLPPQPPIYAAQGATIYGHSNGSSINSSGGGSISAHQQQSSQLTMSIASNQQHNNENLESTSMIYGIYNGNHQVSPNLRADSQMSNVTSNGSEHLQHYSTGNDWKSLSNNNNIISITPTVTQSKQYPQKNSPLYVSSNNSQSKSSSVKTFHQNNHSPSSLDSANTNSLMPMNVKSMLLHGVSGNEVLRNWLCSIKSEEYLQNFIDHGYDIHLINKMTPQDLTAIGIKSPLSRKKFLTEIKKLNLEDDIPEARAQSLEQWLNELKLSNYHATLCSEGYNTIDRVCELTWEDLEEIGINKLGHQKRLLIGIENVVKNEKRLEESVYDVHPEHHRISLNPNLSDNRLSTLGRNTVRSGFFQTRSGASLDHRGLPVATVMPALKHVNTSLANLEISQQVVTTNNTNCTNGNDGNNRYSMNNTNNSTNYKTSNNDQPLKMSDLSATMKRNPPPLPPVRTNSLKIPQGNNNNNIYGNYYDVARSNGGNIDMMPTGPTSFLRTPKLGALTATTNKMLTSGGHIQTVSSQINGIRTIMPVREAPLPPITNQSPSIPQRIEEEFCIQPQNLNEASNQVSLTGNPIHSTFVGNQVGNADEFPPPPPSSQ